MKYLLTVLLMVLASYASAGTEVGSTPQGISTVMGGTLLGKKPLCNTKELGCFVQTYGGFASYTIDKDNRVIVKAHYGGVVVSGHQPVLSIGAQIKRFEARKIVVVLDCTGYNRFFRDPKTKERMVGCYSGAAYWLDYKYAYVKPEGKWSFHAPFYIWAQGSKKYEKKMMASKRIIAINLPDGLRQWYMATVKPTGEWEELTGAQVLSKAPTVREYK